jgi:hypothetical protein
MCGRFTQSYTWRELVELYRLTQPALFILADWSAAIGPRRNRRRRQEIRILRQPHLRDRVQK